MKNFLFILFVFCEKENFISVNNNPLNVVQTSISSTSRNLAAYKTPLLLGKKHKPL